MRIIANGGRYEVRDGDRLLASAGTYGRACAKLADLWRRTLTAAAEVGPAWYATLGFVGRETDDHRLWDAVNWRTLPLPLTAMFSSGHGMPDESVIVGRIDTIDVAADGRVTATGVYDTGEVAVEAARMLENQMLTGISWEAPPDPDGDPVEWDCLVFEVDPDYGPFCSSERMRVPLGTIMAATQVTTPAFGGAQMSLTEIPMTELPPEAPAAVAPPDVVVVEAGIAASGDCGCEPTPVVSAPAAPVLASLVAAGPLHPPAAWFADPGLTEPTPLTVTDDGRVFGHLASWDTCHVSIAGRCQPPPRSAAAYANFLRGTVRTAEGSDARAGLLTIGAAGHAPDAFDAARATAHYANALSAWAQVSAGEDRHGIWLAGALMPDVDEVTLRRVRATGPSGDWRASARGNLELVGAVQVVVQGFPVVRPVLAADGRVLALTASAGLMVGGDRLWALERHVDDLHARLAGVTSVVRELGPAALAAARERVGG